MNVKKIVVATDFSENSLPALEAAFGLAQDWKADLYMLHILEMPAGVQVGFEVVDLGPLPYEEGTQRLNSLVPKNYPPGLRVDGVVRSGRAASEISRLAEELDADLIVIGTHGRKGLSRLLLGSTAEALLRKAPCQVLVAKPHLRSGRLEDDGGAATASDQTRN